MNRLCAAAALALALLLGLAPARAADAVKTRAAEHEHFGRIALDWPAPVGFEARLDGTTLAIRFERSFTTKLAPVTNNLASYVSSVSLDDAGTTLTATLKRPVTLKTFTDGNTIAIDLVAEAGAATQRAAAPVQTGDANPVPKAPPPAAANQPGAASSGEKAAVVVRFGEHDGYRRLVFDWPATVTYTLSEDHGSARLHFGRPAELDATRIGAALPDAMPRVSDEAGGTTLTLRVPGGSQLRHFRSGDSIVLDLLAKAAPIAKANAPGKSVPPAKPAAPANASAPTSIMPPPELIEPTAGPSAVSPLPPSPQQGQKNLPPPQRLVPGPTSSAAPAPSSALPVHYASASDTASLHFPWPSQVPMAVFRRSGALWIVFGAVGETDLQEVAERGKAAVERIEQIPSPGATVVRVVTRRGLEPSIRRNDNDWIVDLKAQDPRAESAITVSAQPSARPARVVFEMRTAVEPVSLADPDVGDRLLVVPTLEVGRGLLAESSTVAFRALVSVQGLVIRPNQEGVIARSVASGIEVTAPEGLVLSGDGDRLLGSAGASSARLFDFPSWYGPEKQSFLDRRSELERVVAAAPSNQRSQPRLALAQFYFARLYAAEALGVLDAIDRDDANFAADRVVRAMRGAAALMNADHEQASQELLRPTLDNEPEVGLWRGALAAGDGDWVTAAKQFLRGGSLLTGYPKTLRNRFALKASEALIRTGNAEAAGTLLRMVQSDAPAESDRAMARFLEGLQAKEQGNLARALETWQEVSRSDDRPSRARALLERTMELFQEGKVSRTDAIQQLDALRFSWRGDAFEFDLLRALGTLLIADGEQRRGIDLLRQATSNFPNHPDVAVVQRQMVQAFGDVFTGPNADANSPLKALALYQEFKELLEASGKSEAVVRHLADRLIAVDLLDQADGLLEDQAANHLKGAEKARTATELAVVRLLDHRPEAALKALDMTSSADLTPEQARQRRQLRARALVDLGRMDQALAALADDQSRDADRLRADVYWKTKAWQDAARIFERLVDVPAEGEKLNRKSAQIVLNWAAALTLSGDQAGIARLRDRFGTAMAATPSANAFRLIASDDGAAGSDDPRDRARRLTEVGELKSFAAELRKSLGDADVGAAVN